MKVAKTYRTEQSLNLHTDNPRISARYINIYAGRMFSPNIWLGTIISVRLLTTHDVNGYSVLTLNISGYMMIINELSRKEMRLIISIIIFNK